MLVAKCDQAAHFLRRLGEGDGVGQGGGGGVLAPAVLLAQRVVAGDAVAQEGLGGGEDSVHGAGGEGVHGAKYAPGRADGRQHGLQKTVWGFVNFT